MQGCRNLHTAVNHNYNDVLDIQRCGRDRDRSSYFKVGNFFLMPLTQNVPIFSKYSVWRASGKLPNFGYYIKTENYEVFIPKIAREVYDLEHRKLQK